MIDRIPCINPRCRRTAPADKFEDDDEIVCAKCWKTLPKRLKDRYRALNKRERKLLRLIEKAIAKRQITTDRLESLRWQIWDLRVRNWREIRSFFLAPEKPGGLEYFLEEIGL